MTDTADSANRRIWRIAGPAILANCSAALIGLVDTWAVGHLPRADLLAAVGIGAFLFSFLFWSFGFLRMGTTGMVAQAHGRDDGAAIRDIVMRAAVVGVGVAALVVLGREVLIGGGLAFIAPEAGLDDPIRRYTGIRVWSAPAVLIKLVIIGFLIGTGRARTALGLELLVNLSNAGLTILFVQGLGWGIAGAAWGSLLAEIGSAVVGAVIVARLLGGEALVAVVRAPSFWRFAGFVPLISGNLFLFLRTLLLLMAFATMWRAGAGIGSLTASANQVLLQFLTLISLALDGVAYAAEAEVGRAIGRRDRPLFDRMVGLTTLWAGLFALGFTLLFGVAGADLVAFFTEHAAVRDAAGAHLLWIVLLPVVAVWSYQFDGIYIGATAFGAMMATMMAAFALFVALVVGLVPRYGNDGLWAALTGLMAMRGLAQAAWFPWLRRASFRSSLTEEMP